VRQGWEIGRRAHHLNLLKHDPRAWMVIAVLGVTPSTPTIPPLASHHPPASPRRYGSRRGLLLAMPSARTRSAATRICVWAAGIPTSFRKRGFRKPFSQREDIGW